MKRPHQLELADTDPLPVIYFAPIQATVRWGRILPERHYFQFEGFMEYQDYYWPCDEG